jgi:hypothetical protein
MRDFTLDIYKKLISAAQNGGYRLIGYDDFATNKFPSEKVYILRHDVDAIPFNSVATAKAESEIGARGTYYFRIVKQSNVPKAIEAIANLGHEIGYHYEDLALQHGNYEIAYEEFQNNLAYFRKYYPVNTICMHGSPMSKWDNRKIWERFDYKKHGIIAEPYFDTDFRNVLYITDTSRRWNGDKYSIRDKVNGLQANFSKTAELIKLLEDQMLPNTIMQNIHPQRWTNDFVSWTSELILQNIKNIIKQVIAK